MQRPLAILIVTVIVGAAAGLGVDACRRTEEPTPPPTPSPAARPTPSPAPAGSSTSGAASAPTAPVAGAERRELSWNDPPGWKRVAPSSAMRKASYKVPAAPGDPEDGDMSVVQAGGSIEANVERWAGQFDSKARVTRSERSVGGVKVTVVEVHGTYTGMSMSGDPAPAKPKSALLGAIVSTSSEPLFFKLTGPEKTIDIAKPEFEKMIDSLRVK